jgi:hypothetical protein
LQCQPEVILNIHLLQIVGIHSLPITYAQSKILYIFLIDCTCLQTTVYYYHMSVLYYTWHSKYYTLLL